MPANPTPTRRSSRAAPTPTSPHTKDPMSPLLSSSQRTTRKYIQTSVKDHFTKARPSLTVPAPAFALPPDEYTSSPDPLALVSPSPVSPTAIDIHTPGSRGNEAKTRRIGGENAIAGPSQPTQSPSRHPRAIKARIGGAEAEESPFRTPISTPQDGKTTPSRMPGPRSPRTNGSAAKVPEKRVLPARIRRAAGGGAEGIRDLEEMIVDWLERWGAPCTTPPDNLPIHLSTLPLSLLDPPTQISSSSQPAPPLITLTPNQSSRMPTPSPRRSTLVLDTEERIETPSWKLVRPGEDDQEEAREELEGRKIATSPVKRLRRLPGDEATEDTSDAYYNNLHKKYEVFERRQRIREKEKLVFERYKMRSRIDLLRNMSSGAWSSIVAVVLARYSSGENEVWEKGRKQVEVTGVDWLRDKLVKEGKELVKRYDQLLPVEHKKSRADRSFSTPTPTPPRQLTSPTSLSPPPVLPARVSALREPVSHQKRARASSESKHKPAPAKVENRRSSEAHGASHTRNSITASPRKRRKSEKVEDPSLKTEHDENDADDMDQDGQNDHAAYRPSPSALPSSISDGSPPRHSSPPRSPSAEPFYPPLTLSGLPCLVEAASRRESALEEILAAQAKVEAAASAKNDGKRLSRFIAREKTRTSGRLGVVQPFGLPIPPVVEYKSEFTLTDEEDFWGIIADREARAVHQRRQSLVSPADTLSAGNSVSVSTKTTAASLGPGVDVSKEDVMDMREVEASVVL